MSNNIVCIAGDWHINTSWALRQLQRVAAEGVTEVFHVGDFGFDSTEEGIDYLNTVNDYCESHNLTIFVTPGNHENFPFMYTEFRTEDQEGFMSSNTWNRIRVIPRGHRWARNSKTFVSLGGANSINRASLIPNIDWWAEEQISYGDLYRTTSGGHADIMIAHDCPISAAPADDTDSEWPAEALSYAQESQRNVEIAVQKVAPQIFFHGHHHNYRDETFTIGGALQRIVGLDMDGEENNLTFLNLETLEHEPA